MFISTDKICAISHGQWDDNHGMWLLHDNKVYLLSKEGAAFVMRGPIGNSYIQLDKLDPLREAVVKSLFPKEVLRYERERLTFKESTIRIYNKTNINYGQ